MTEQEIQDVLARWGNKDNNNNKPPHIVKWGIGALACLAIAAAIILSLNKKSVPDSGSSRFIEFIGNGIVAYDQPYSPGDSVLIFYTLRRNLGCVTDVEVRFLNADRGGIETSLTYRIPSTRAPITSDYIIFPVRVRLPNEMQAGRWAYSSILTPKDCIDNKAVIVPISNFFTVL